MIRSTSPATPFRQVDALRLVLLAVAVYVVMALLWAVVRDGWHGWKTADWPINYEGGLLGEGFRGRYSSCHVS